MAKKKKNAARFIVLPETEIDANTREKAEAELKREARIEGGTTYYLCEIIATATARVTDPPIDIESF